MRYLIIFIYLFFASTAFAAEPPITIKETKFDSLIIDATEENFVPALTNRIFSSSGYVVYDPAIHVPQEVLVEQGSADYASSMDKAKAMLKKMNATNPLIITATGIFSSSKKDILVSDGDALKISGEDKKTGFLANARVVFVLKPAPKIITVTTSAVPVSTKASMEIRKQEAFVAAFLAGVRAIVEEIKFKGLQTIHSEDEGTIHSKDEGTIHSKDEGTIHSKDEGRMFISFHMNIADFEVDTQTVIKDLVLDSDLIIINYLGQKFVIKDFQLLYPSIELVKFPEWSEQPKKISDFEIKDMQWSRREVFKVTLAYLYDEYKIRKKVKERGIAGFDFVKDNAGNNIYKTITIDGTAYGGGDDTPDIVRKKALDEALRNAVEEVNGVFIQSLTEVKDLQLTKDEIVSQTLGIAKVRDKKFNPKFTSDGTYEVACTVIAEVPIVRINIK